MNSNDTQRPVPRIVTPPAAEPITVAEARAQCSIDDTDADALLALYIQAAREQCELITGRALITQTLELGLDAFPDGAIALARPPIASVSSVTYIDTSGQLQTVDLADYVVDARADPGFVMPAYGKAWPATLDSANAVIVRYVAGYGTDGSAVPAAIRQWLLMRVATAFRNRETFVEGRPTAELPGRFADGLLDPFIVWTA